MNEEQHYTVTEVHHGEPPVDMTYYRITVDDGYYITPDDIRVFNSDFEPTDPNVFYLFRLDNGDYMLNNSNGAFQIDLGSVNDIHVTPHKKEDTIDLPDIVKQKIKNEEYTIDITCNVVENNICIDGTNYLQSCSLDVDRFIKGQGVIGGFVANEFELKLIGFPNVDIIGNHLDISAIINYQDNNESHSYVVPIGTYIISTNTYDDTSGTYTLKAYDNALLYNVDYVPKVQFPCTTIELVNDVVNQTEQKLSNTTGTYVGIIPANVPYDYTKRNYYFTVDGTNYGFTTCGGEGPYDPLNMVRDTGFVFNGEDVLLKMYFKNVYSDAQNVRTGSAQIIYESVKVVELQDTNGYVPVDVHPVQYTPFNNNLFIIPSNPFDVMTQTNQNDQSVTVTHASCRKVIQDVAKLLYGWAYINNNGELAFDTLTNILTTNVEDFVIDGKMIIHEPPNPNEIISPHNVAETEYLTWGQATVSTNYMCLNTRQIYTLWDNDGLEIRTDFTDIKINRPTGETSVTTTNDERVVRFQDLDYKISNSMFIRWEIEGFQHIPYIKYIHNNEEIESTDTTILFEPGDNIIAIGYVLNAHTYVDDDCILHPYFSTMDNYGHPYEKWEGDLSERYGVLNYIDELHNDKLTYVFNKNSQNYGKTVLHLGTQTVDCYRCTWQYNEQDELFYTELPTEYEPSMWIYENIPIRAVDGTVLWCSHYQAKIPDSNDDYAVFIDNNILYIRDRDYTSLEDWNIWARNVWFRVSYGLENPVNIVVDDDAEELMSVIERAWKPSVKLLTFSSLGSDYKTINKELNINKEYNYIDTNHYITSKQIGKPTEPIASVLLGLKDIEGENVCFKITSYGTITGYGLDSWDVLKDMFWASGDGHYPCMEIYDNDITFTPELRELALIGGAECLFGVSYTPLEIEMPGMPWLINCAPYIFENVDGDVTMGYAFKSHFEYKGYIKQKISSDADTTVESEYTYDGSYTSALNQTRYIVDKQNQQITSLVQRVEDTTSELSRIQQDVRSWTAEFESVGGGNYIKNSVGLGDATNLVWEFTEDSNTSTYTYGTTSDASLYTKSGSRWYLNGYKMTQTINVLQNSQYAFACKIKKPIDTNENCYIKIYDTNNPDNYKEIVPDPAKEYNYDEFILSGDNAITPQTTNITVEVYASEGCQLTISDMMLNAGTMNSVWTPAAGEILTTNVKMDAGGLRVLSTDYINNGLGDYTMVTPSYFRGYGNNNGTEECVFQVSGTETSTHDLQVRNSQVYGNASSSHYNTKVVPVINSNYDGVAFIKTQGN